MSGLVLSLALVALVAAAAPNGPPPLVLTPAVARQSAEPIDQGLIARVRDEGLERSDLQRIVHQLTDVYGPRLTGGPNLENAGRWAIKTMEGWGLTNGGMEPWDWGHEGWQNERALGHIIAPVRDRLEFEVLAWTPSTTGTVTAEAFNILPPTGPLAPAAPPGRGRGRGPVYLGPTQMELDAYLASIENKVVGRMVLMGPRAEVPVDFTPSPMRTADDQVRGRYAPPDPNAPPQGGRGNFGGGRGRGTPPGNDGRLTAQQVSMRVAEFLRAHRPLVRIYDAARPHGQIDAYNVAGYNASATLPSILMRNEDYGRIARILADGTPVTLEFEIVNRTFPEGRTAYNAVAEIRGSDRADEVVMLGGHLDSWHSATGATDNAIGCAVMMEAVRILQAVGAKPRRTIRVALWSGEEQGLFGSKAYVASHFGNAESPRADFRKLAGYWNVDGGTGRLRGVTVFGPPEAAAVLSALLKPFEDFGVFGARATRSRSSGNTDSGSFNAAGLPGIDSDQDPIEYEPVTHHTNLDTYERIVWDDVRKAAVVTASVVYHLATRDELVPRFSPESMPAPPTQGRGGQ